MFNPNKKSFGQGGKEINLTNKKEMEHDKNLLFEPHSVCFSIGWVKTHGNHFTFCRGHFKQVVLPSRNDLKSDIYFLGMMMS